ncbi:MAG: hypothetical protein K6G51_04770 [Sphaerochaetaceae bacterium]|nr:hypothetical protein [Sphaerochaetaceae bacterium]
MKIKKLQWINAPKKARIINSYTFSFLSETEHRLVYTFEEGEIGVKVEKEEAVEDALEILISQRSFIRVSKADNGTLVHLMLSGIETKSYFSTSYNSNWKVVKNSSEVEILVDENKLFSFKAPTTEKAISVCVLTRGQGQVNCYFQS